MKILKCTGMCAECGRCLDRKDSQEHAGEKAGMLVFPEDFIVESREGGAGVAVDIGTTTIAATMWSLRTGKLLAWASRTNPQSIHGADVITRITYCGKGRGNKDEMRRLVTEGINDLIHRMCDDKGLDPGDITRAVVCGNITMSHIFAGYDPAGLAKAPFSSAYRGTVNKSGRSAGLNMREDGKVTILPGVAGHVGGDITAGITAARLTDQGKTTLYIDFGTNGEIVLFDGRRLFACSTSAGPALEGASVTCGMRAAAGAIEKVKGGADDIRLSVIGGVLPEGICGSGVIDATAWMLKNGVMDERGRVISKAECTSEQLSRRLIEYGGSRALLLAEAFGGRQVVMTQGDIRQIQMVKAAIRAGIWFLLEQAGLCEDEIGQVIVAGAFGNHIDMESAAAIGLIPDTGVAVRFVGNASGTGAAMALLSQTEERRIEEAAEGTIHVELAGETGFQQVYLGFMGF